MKKLIVGLLATFLMTTGLVAFSGTSATAACPYTSCVPTATVAVGVAKKGKSAQIKVKTIALGSNMTPQGNVFVKVYKKKKNGNLKQVRRLTGELNGAGKIQFNVDNLKKGKYKFGAEFKGNQDRGFGYSIGFGKFKIKK